jgi:hypothetical protein
MRLEDILPDLQYEYESVLRLSNVYFNKFIETGEENYKEKELLNSGAAYAIHRVIQIIKHNYEVKQ